MNWFIREVNKKQSDNVNMIWFGDVTTENETIDPLVVAQILSWTADSA